MRGRALRMSFVSKRPCWSPSVGATLAAGFGSWTERTSVKVRSSVGGGRRRCPRPGFTARLAMTYDAPRDPRDWTHGMNSGLADFIERHSETIIEHAITFAKTVDVGTPMDDVALRDHLPDIVQAIVADLRTPQTSAQELEKSEGRTLAPLGHPRSAAG